MSGGWDGGRGWWNQLSTFDAEFKFAKKKKYFFCEKFSKFLDKKHNGFVFDFEYQVARLYRRTTIKILATLLTATSHFTHTEFLPPVNQLEQNFQYIFIVSF